MAVAVKNPTEGGTSSPFDRLPVASLLGLVYLLASLAIVFKLIPSLWTQYVTANTSVTSGLLEGLVMLLAAGVLGFVGVRLLGPRPIPGIKAGIFVGLLGIVLILLLTRWFGGWMESLALERRWFGKDVGVIVTAVFGLALVLLGLRLWFRPGTEQMLVGFEGAGWFSTQSYKRRQGLMVRRGTILGILLLVGAGVWTLVTHGTLQRGSRDWALNIPFTGKVEVTPNTAQDAKPLIAERFPGWAENPEAKVDIDRFVLRDEINSKVDPATHVKVDWVGIKTNPGPEDLQGIVPKQRYEEEVKRLKAEGKDVPEAKPPVPATGPIRYDTLVLLPAVQFTVPLFLIALALWCAWRIVNIPTFADFLIATEAELNKVSWTPRKRLLQDTVVVLVTVFLMAFFLFVMDQVVTHTLSWKPIGIIQLSEEPGATKGGPGQKPW
jgi:preprotein translocase SecE subunit